LKRNYEKPNGYNRVNPIINKLVVWKHR